ncbi:uncharacterized protein [Montipora capricornis]|uniref:uncharacterized protein isoform X2 n=1 Tax=Montipora capricornis TaxID=246305 RepID=UPI0035F21769
MQRGNRLLRISTIFKITGFLFLLYLSSGYEAATVIDTSEAKITAAGINIPGTIESKSFNGPNNGTWNYSVATFTLNPGQAEDLFSAGKNVSIKGSHALSISVTGNFMVATNLDVSGKEITYAADEKPLFWLGGFLRVNKSCCTLGAGPGGAFSFHGGGHGGRGGGFYQDSNTSRFYGWSYYDTDYLLGGSTGTVLFGMKSGSGGGAIELVSMNGTLTIDASITANGYSSENTSEFHCAGGSSGGLIRLLGDKVVITQNGSLRAVGGDSGYSTNHSSFCGGGGGGGVIQVFCKTDIGDYIANSSVRTRGGRGVQYGEKGIEQVALFFDEEMDLKINTTSCQMQWGDSHRYNGSHLDRQFQVPGKPSYFTLSYKICKIAFTSTIYIGSQVRVNISGEHAFSMESTHGNIEIKTPIDISGSSKFIFVARTSIGGFVKRSAHEVEAGLANVSNCSSAGLYGHDFETLLGGSICFETGSDKKAVGGGALELRAKNGAIAIDAKISADGYSEDSSIGAMGGTIRLDAREVLLRRKALLTARSSMKDKQLASGGIIQIKSNFDVRNLCDSKFDVSGGKLGLVNILVSTANTKQVQYVQDGILTINTTIARWTHMKRSLNSSIAYSYYGEIVSKTLKVDNQEDFEYGIAKFEFQVPILMNGSASVEIVGLNSLAVSSREGIFIGVDLDVGKTKGEISKTVGGYCTNLTSLSAGEGPGRGKPSANGGAGHGGQGGMIFEDEAGVVYGDTYGLKPDIHLIGGSGGTTTGDAKSIVACGGGAIKIYTEKNLTINAAIRANGETHSLFDKTSTGGSSGGTIILESKKYVILSEKAILEAKGSSYFKGNSSDVGGGGGGGVIAINFEKGFVGMEPDANRSTMGGNGTFPGDNGLIIINGTRRYGYPAADIEDDIHYIGCVNISNPLPASFKVTQLRAHEASPRHCYQTCRENQSYWASISLKRCVCYNDNSTMDKVDDNDLCNARCKSNTSLICGGRSGFGSAYRTGYVPSSSTIYMTAASTLVSAVYSGKTLAEFSPSSVEQKAGTESSSAATKPIESSTTSSTETESSSAATKPIESSTTSSTETESSSAATMPIESSTTSSTDEATTKSPTEPAEKFKQIEDIILTENNSLTVVEKLKNLTSEETLNGGDTKVALVILQKLASNDNLLPKDKQTQQKLGQSFLDVASSLISEENKDNWGVTRRGEHNTSWETSPLQILEFVENVGLKLGKQLGYNESVVFESRNIAMGVDTKPPDGSHSGRKYPRYDDLTSQWKTDDFVFIHKEIFDEMAKDNSKRTVAVYTVYNQSTYFPASSNDGFVNSAILGMQFNKPLKTPFKKPIQLRFKKLQIKNASKPSCSFVDFKQNLATWSKEGCHVVQNGDLSVTCACNHLTNFAILMQVKEFHISPDHLKALTAITYVGCGISLFGLVLTLATFLSLETLASERTSIHKNLVVAIGLAQIIFLAGIDATYNPIACKAVALFLHYFYTAAFTWMLCEGIHLYSKVVEVFSEGSKMKYYYALGWGLPLTIVFISACSRWSGYGNERACWISIADGLIWAFVVPVLIIMMINFVIMIMVIRVVVASVTSLHNSGNNSQVRAGLKGMVVLLPLLGLTWVFGIMAINKDTIVFQYLFAILNSLQGLFIFAFHCIGNSEVRVAYKRLHEKRTLAKTLPEHSLSTSHHSREKRRMDSHETHVTGDDDIVVTKTIRSVSDVKLSGDNVAMQTFGDTDSGRWSLNCPSPDPLLVDHTDHQAKRA